MTSELPAITAAWAAANEHIGGPPTERGVILPEIVTEDRVRRILTAALPALTAAAIAAERERVRAQLLDVVTSHAASGNDWLLSELLTAIRELGGTADGAHTPGGAT